MKPETAKLLLQLRDELAKGNTDEAYHCLYQIADVNFESTTPWKELEKIASLPAPTVATDNSGERQIKAEEILQEELDKIGKGNTTQIQFCYKAIFNAMDRFSNCKSKSSRLEKEHDCEFFLVTDVAVYACECDPHHILIDNQEYVPVASPVEEEQEELFALWMEMGEKQLGYSLEGAVKKVDDPSRYVFYKLKEHFNFTITRKS